MGQNSKIEWTHHTFSPWWGCQKVSPACDHCYAERDALRFYPHTPLWGAGSTRRTFGAGHWRQPVNWNERAKANGTRERVFCASMADVFDKDGPASERVLLWDLIRGTPYLDWLLLTKRVGNVRGMVPPEWLDDWPRNAWLGISVVNQQEIDRDVPKLLALPARTRFLSCEPLLGAVDLRAYLGDRPVYRGDNTSGFMDYEMNLHWVIVGGESGPHARPMHPMWARAVRDQCVAAGVPFLFKQHGEWMPTGPVQLVADEGRWYCFTYGGENDGAEWMARVGKKAAGRTLDGRTWDQYPEVA